MGTLVESLDLQLDFTSYGMADWKENQKRGSVRL
jgi:hypothetical protein